ncbi:hypothetical protein JHK82_045561 [Glycine max]|uniref:LysM domain-containing protein n=2 Tax=Glycine soja TaxID=3848 RepID=A0A445GLD9_GLYSO|nr:uncharacterized protein LOC114390724 isoform X1 [Glycine soja]KAG5100509.1 hypothetical protein JHK82_045561 [Glycine max]KAG5109098.1 hypothetical protein JHK84_046005 [Glycine max]RZB62050.1 hypothetical protein D0Y65_044354 [Glycine soja]
MSPSNGFHNGGGGGSGGGGGNGVSYIEHQVSKLDTLAGVAIKYGVEVADIKRMNGLATDLQMFALKTLKIPLPGRHPPSPAPGTHDEPAKSGEASIERKPLRIGQSAMKEPLQSLGLKPPQPNISPAMSILQKFYGLKSSNSRDTLNGTEMAVYLSSNSDHSSGEWLPKASPILDLPSASNDYPRSTNLVYDLLTGDDEYVPLAEIGDTGVEKSDEKSVRRRQKAEVDNGTSTPEKIMKEGNGNGSNGLSSNGKTLAMRPKSASRAALFPESESGWLDSIPVGLGESIFTDGFSGVRKSSSASSLREQEKNNSAAAWPPAIWSLKPDLQAAISKPIFDGLPIPISGRRSKAALD